jgi:hypothetical protein
MKVFVGSSVDERRRLKVRPSMEDDFTLKSEKSPEEYPTTKPEQLILDLYFKEGIVRGCQTSFAVSIT